MSHSIGPSGADPDDPAALRGDIEGVRADLAETVNALAYKADLKARSREKAKEVRAQASEWAEELRAQAAPTAQQLAGVAQDKAQQALRVAKENPGQARVVGAAFAVLTLLVLRGRRRRRREDRRRREVSW